MKESGNKNSFINLIPKWSIYYLTAIIPLFITAVYSFYLLILDPDPPKLPGKATDEFVDCSFIRTLGLSTDHKSSRIGFHFKVGDFLQFPKSAAMSLIKVEMRTGSVRADYGIKNFWDPASNLSNIFFNVLHPYTGDTLINVKCGNIKLATSQTKVQEIEVYPIGWSRIFTKDFETAQLTDACYVNKSLVLAVVSDAKFEPMISSKGSEIPVNFTHLSTLIYSTTHNITYNNKDTMNPYAPNVLILDADPKLGYQKIVDVMIPVWAFSYSYNGENKQQLILTHDQFNQYENIEPIFNGDVKGSSENICFSRGTVLSSTGSKSYTVPKEFYDSKDSTFTEYLHYNLISMLDQEILIAMRDRFMLSELGAPSPPEKTRIVLDSNLASLSQIIKKLYPEAIVDVISDTNLLKITAKTLSKANVFVGSNIKTLAYSIFMQKGTHIVEVVPNGLSCIAAGRFWAQKLDLEYSQLGSAFCTVSQLEDYFKELPNAAYPSITHDMIKNVFDPIIRA